jgi:hypothetical protein
MYETEEDYAIQQELQLFIENQPTAASLRSYNVTVIKQTIIYIDLEPTDGGFVSLRLTYDSTGKTKDAIGLLMTKVSLGIAPVVTLW